MSCRLLFVLLSIAGVAHPAAARAEDPGTAPWTPVARDEVAAQCGLDPDLLDAASPQLEATPFVVIRHGRLCWEGGAQPNGTTEPYAVYSVTKTFGAMLFGMVVDRSTVLSDTSRAADWIPPEQMTRTDGTINPDARIAHILGMVSTNADLRYGKKGAWSYDTTGSREINTLVGVMDRAIAAEPDRFGGAKDSAELAQRELFDPLGMKDTSWPGEQIGGNLVTSVRDMARLGQLLLQRGVWNGRRIISEEWLYRMTHPSFEDANTGYGYLTYVNAHDNWSWPTSTADTYCAPYGESPGPNDGVPGNRAQRYDIAHTFASGTGGQKFIVYRGVDTVIAIRNGAGSVADGGTAADQFSGHKTVWNAMRPAMLAFDPVYKGDEEGFCAAYRRSDYAPDLREPWFKESAVAGEPPAPPAPPTAARPACTSTRRFTIRLHRPRGLRIRSVSVLVSGRPARVLRGRRLRAVVDLRGRGPGLAIVRIVVRGTRKGRPAGYRRTRVYRTCRATS
jgi:CubicO group peptidase (beta-lactamase class C family)